MTVLRSRLFRTAVRLAAGGAVLAAIVARVGAEPFIRGLASLDAATIAVAAALMALATAACAWRWRTIAGGLGVELPMRTAFGMYYRSQFLNAVLPGGVVGDVRRAMLHGRTSENAVAAARAVALERTAGQTVQTALTVVVLGVSSTGPAAPFAGLLPVIVFAVAVLAGAIAFAAAASARFRRRLVREAAEVRAALGSGRVRLQVATASLVACLCYVALFSVAAHAVGAALPPQQGLTVALVVLLASSLPANVGGWGPREGAAGWAFAVTGVGASAGVAAATLFGVLGLIAVVPGAAIAAATSIRASLSRTSQARTSQARTSQARTSLAPTSEATRPNRKEEHRDRTPLRDRELRHLARWLPRHGTASPPQALEPGGLRPGG